MPTDEEYEAALGTEETTPVPSGEAEALSLAVGDQTVNLPLDAEIPITHDGQVIKAPLKTVLNHYRERANLQSKYQQFNQDKTAFDSERQKYQEMEKSMENLRRYEELDKWSLDLQKNNPAGYDHLMNTIEQLKTVGAPPAENSQTPYGVDTNTLTKTIQSLQQKLQEFEGWKSELDAKTQEEQQAKDWEVVQKEMAGFKEKFPEINLDELDEQGTKLYAKIINWGVENGYQDFTPAAYAFLGDKLTDTLMQRGRNETVKGIQKDHSEGIVARSSTPFSTDGQGQGIDTKKKSYDQLGEEAEAFLANQT